jgi:hypothetical protein
LSELKEPRNGKTENGKDARQLKVGPGRRQQQRLAFSELNWEALLLIRFARNDTPAIQKERVTGYGLGKGLRARVKG